MTKLPVAFRNFANAPKKSTLSGFLYQETDFRKGGKHNTNPKSTVRYRHMLLLLVISCYKYE